jgi:NAD-dependent SIR2 family protein deacetylase
MDSNFKTVFCSECDKKIPVEEFDDGTILIHCPKCTGECLTCDCHLVSECFSASPNVKVIHDDSNESNNVTEKKI